ncbi:hypothetical protein [Zoogloea sp. LCSB751]|nr:hypothetical protein [Zoogloea sp. LCSB751]
MHNITAGVITPTLSARFTLYRTLRRITGPAVAYRLTFAGRAAA